VTVPFVVLGQAALIAAGFTGVVFGAIMFLGGIAATWYVTIVT
jgi:hypothetical protein